MSSQSLLSAAKTEQERRDAFNADCDRDPREAFGAKPRQEPQGLDATLAERAARYGDFTDVAHYAQSMNEMLRRSPSWSSMTPIMREGLEMVVHKIARIAAGDPAYADSWIDISGYAKLVADRLKAA